jgi:uncharacterized OB-fold protein
MNLQRPALISTADSAPFWLGLEKGVLSLLTCTACGIAMHYPRARCPKCWSNHVAWRTASGLGIVTSVTVIHRPGHPAWLGNVPYTVALVQLEEGPCVLSNVVDIEPSRVTPGMAVHARCVTENGQTLLKFAPRASPDARGAS